MTDEWILCKRQKNTSTEFNIPRLSPLGLRAPRQGPTPFKRMASFDLNPRAAVGIRRSVTLAEGRVRFARPDAATPARLRVATPPSDGEPLQPQPVKVRALARSVTMYGAMTQETLRKVTIRTDGDPPKWLVRLLAAWSSPSAYFLFPIDNPIRRASTHVVQSAIFQWFVLLTILVRLVAAFDVGFIFLVCVDQTGFGCASTAQLHRPGVGIGQAGCFTQSV